MPYAPDEADFAAAAEWTVTIPATPPALADAVLTLRYSGDMARLYRGDTLVDDNFWNGLPFEVGLDELGNPAATTFTLRVLPQRSDYTLYLEDPSPLQFDTKAQAATLESVRITPVYRLDVHAAPPK